MKLEDKGGRGWGVQRRNGIKALEMYTCFSSPYVFFFKKISLFSSSSSSFFIYSHFCFDCVHAQYLDCVLEPVSDARGVPDFSYTLNLIRALDGRTDDDDENWNNGAHDIGAEFKY